MGGVFIIKLVFIRLSRKLLITSSRVGTIISTFSLPLCFLRAAHEQFDAQRGCQKRKEKKKEKKKEEEERAAAAG